MASANTTKILAAVVIGICVIGVVYRISSQWGVHEFKPYFSETRVTNRHLNCSNCVRRKAEDILTVEPQVQRVVEEMVAAKVDANDKQLVQVIRDYFIDWPRPFLSKFSMHIFQTEQAKAVNKLLNKDKGFFVECGALDGERSSNTNWLEQKRGWNGLLIEMDPSYYLQIRGKNRKCFSINACLSPEPHPAIVPFKEHAMGQGRLETDFAANDPAVHDSYCFPLLSIMLALNRTHIDYFSLDVEGLEIPVLKTIPFDQLDISVFTVEYSHQKSKQEMVRFMESKGYKVHADIHASKPEIYYGCDDFVFVKNKKW